MERWNRLWIAGAIVTALVPIAAAETTTCAAQSDPNATPLGDGLYYIKYRLAGGTVTVSIWAETNDLDGLQTAPTPCGYKQPQRDADARIGEASNGGGLRILVPGLGDLADQLFD